jgi:lysozyme family protein
LTVLQRALNARGASLTADGGPSAATFAAAATADAVATAEEFARIEEACHQASAKTQYLSAWLERLAEVKAVALSWAPEVTAEEEAESPPPEELPEVLVKALQRDLSKQGYYTGAVDGKFGTLTSAALLGFQHDRSLPLSGVPDAVTTAALGENWQRPLSQDRLTATADDLRTLGSQTITSADNTKLVALVSTILGALGVGNSAVVQVASSQGGVAAAAKSLPSQAPSLIELLNQLEFLLKHPTDKAAIAKIPQLRDYVAQLVNNDWSNLSPAAISQTTQQLSQLNQQLSHAKPPVDLQSLIDQIDFLSRCSTPDTFVSVLANLGTTCAQSFANAGTGPSLTSGLDMLTNSLLPGFGGALLTLAIGLGARYFSNQAIQSRVQDHQTGRNLGR